MFESVSGDHCNRRYRSPYWAVVAIALISMSSVEEPMAQNDVYDLPNVSLGNENCLKSFRMPSSSCETFG